MSLDVNTLQTFGDTRRDLLDTLQQLKRGEISPALGMALFAGHKVLNENIQTELNVAKFSLQTKDEIHTFAKITGMGQRLIANSPGQIT